MAISYPMFPPAVGGPSSAQIVLRRAQSSSVSPFTFRRQVYDWGGDQWEMVAKLAPLSPDHAGAWEAFILALNGRMGSFVMGIPMRNAPRGTQQTDIAFDGDHLTRASTIAVKGMTPGATLLAGDLISVGSGPWLHKILNTVSADAGGFASLEIAPRLREAAANDAAIDVTYPRGVWRLKDTDTDWTIDDGRFSSVTISAEEAL